MGSEVIIKARCCTSGDKKRGSGLILFSASPATSTANFPTTIDAVRCFCLCSYTCGLFVGRIVRLTIVTAWDRCIHIGTSKLEYQATSVAAPRVTSSQADFAAPPQPWQESSRTDRATAQRQRFMMPLASRSNFCSRQYMRLISCQGTRSR